MSPGKIYGGVARQSAEGEEKLPVNGMENTFNNGIRVMSGLMGSSAVSAAPLPPSSGRSRALWVPL